MFNIFRLPNLDSVDTRAIDTEMKTTVQNSGPPKEDETTQAMPGQFTDSSMSFETLPSNSVLASTCQDTSASRNTQSLTSSGFKIRLPAIKPKPYPVHQEMEAASSILVSEAQQNTGSIAVGSSTGNKRERDSSPSQSATSRTQESKFDRYQTKTKIRVVKAERDQYIHDLENELGIQGAALAESRQSLGSAVNVRKSLEQRLAEVSKQSQRVQEDLEKAKQEKAAWILQRETYLEDLTEARDILAKNKQALESAVDDKELLERRLAEVLEKIDGLQHSQECLEEIKQEKAILVLQLAEKESLSSNFTQQIDDAVQDALQIQASKLKDAYLDELKEAREEAAQLALEKLRWEQEEAREEEAIQKALEEEDIQRERELKQEGNAIQKVIEESKREQEEAIHRALEGLKKEHNNFRQKIEKERDEAIQHMTQDRLALERLKDEHHKALQKVKQERDEANHQVEQTLEGSKQEMDDAAQRVLEGLKGERDEVFQQMKQERDGMAQELDNLTRVIEGMNKEQDKFKQERDRWEQERNGLKQEMDSVVQQAKQDRDEDLQQAKQNQERFNERAKQEQVVAIQQALQQSKRAQDEAVQCALEKTDQAIQRVERERDSIHQQLEELKQEQDEVAQWSKQENEKLVQQIEREQSEALKKMQKEAEAIKLIKQQRDEAVHLAKEQVDNAQQALNKSLEDREEALATQSLQYKKAQLEQNKTHQQEMQKTIRDLEESFKKRQAEQQAADRAAFTHDLGVQCNTIKEEMVMQAKATLDQAIEDQARQLTEKAEQNHQEMLEQIKEKDDIIKKERASRECLVREIACLRQEQQEPPDCPMDDQVMKSQPGPLQMTTDNTPMDVDHLPSARALGKRPQSLRLPQLQAEKAIQKRELRLRNIQHNVQPESIGPPTKFAKPFRYNTPPSRHAHLSRPVSTTFSSPTRYTTPGPSDNSTPSRDHAVITTLASGSNTLSPHSDHSTTPTCSPVSTRVQVENLTSNVTTLNTLDASRLIRMSASPEAPYQGSPNVGVSGSPPGHTSSAPPDPTAPSILAETFLTNAINGMTSVITTEFRALRKEFADTRKCLVTPSPKKFKIREHGEFKVRHTPKPRTTMRNQLMAAVRIEMNNLLGIAKDNDIVNVVSNIIVTQAEYDDFMTGNIAPPPLEPMRPYWDVLKNAWNEHIASLFADHMICEDPDLAGESTAIISHFLQRLECLRKILLKHLPHTDQESSEEISQRIREQAHTSLHARRIRGRKDTLFKVRLRIATEGAEGDQTGAWQILYLMVDSLGLEGQSSDETDDKSYTVRVKEWRSKEVRTLLEYIDANRKLTNIYGNAKSGTRPHVRIRSTYAPLSAATPIAALPRNFYDDVWYDSLAPRRQRDLGATAPLSLPTLD